VFRQSRKKSKKKSLNELKLNKLILPKYTSEKIDEIIIGNIIVYKNKIIGEGSFSKTYLGYNSTEKKVVTVKFCSEEKYITSALIEKTVLDEIEVKKINGFPSVN